MNCPTEIAKILLQIVRRGILLVRNSGWDNNGERATTEANHVHNLPSLLTNYSPELLAFYWNIERPQYIQERAENGEQATEFKSLWAQLKLAAPTLKSDEQTEAF